MNAPSWVADRFERAAGSARDLPLPGRSRGRPLYVGKAKSLRKRVPSLPGRDLEPRSGSDGARPRELECVVTDTEAEALLLENNWIKRATAALQRPAAGRQDLSLPQADQRALAASGLHPAHSSDDGADYFGPYLPGGLARRAIKLVQKLFGVRVCSIEIDGGLPRPCLYHDMKRCLGPCVDGLTSAAEYKEAVEGARLFLGGKIGATLPESALPDGGGGRGLEFERAGRLRDLVREIERQSTRSPLSSVLEEDIDSLRYRGARQPGGGVDPRHAGRPGARPARALLGGREAAAPPQILSELLPQIYDRTTFLPKEIHLPFEVDGEEALAEWLSERKGERVYLRHPERGPKAERLRIAAQGRRVRLSPAISRRSGARRGPASPGPTPRPRRAAAMDRRLRHLEPPGHRGGRLDGRLARRPHCARASTAASTSAASTGRRLRSIAEAVERRYRRLLDESGVLPDLVMIDGGRGQLNAAATALAGIERRGDAARRAGQARGGALPPRGPQPLRLPRRDDGLRLLQKLRDEAHRFAVSRHRRRRTSTSLRSRLEEIPGVGPTRRKLLSKRYGTWELLSLAPVEEIQEVLGEALGAAVHRHVHAEPAAAVEID